MEANPQPIAGKPYGMPEHEAYRQIFEEKIDQMNPTGETAYKSFMALSKSSDSLKKELDTMVGNAYGKYGIPTPDKFDKMKINERKSLMQKLGFNPKTNNEAWDNYSSLRSKAVSELGSDYDRKWQIRQQQVGMAQALQGRAMKYKYSK